MLSVLLGVGLSAACGFRLFVPLLGLSLAARAGLVDLTPGFDWMATTPAVWMFGTATVCEIAAFYILWLDHTLDIVATPLASLAGVVLTAAVLTEANPALRWTLAVLAGGGAATTVQAITVAGRGTLLATAGGLLNPLAATVEWLGALGMTAMAILAPAAAVAALATLVAAFVWVLRRRAAVQTGRLQMLEALESPPSAG